jgi:Family of unknown function (DUF5771)
MTKEGYPVLKPGRLYGWHAADPPTERHKHVRRAVEEDGYATVIERLNELHRINDRPGHKTVAKKAQADMHWLQSQRAEGARWTED